MKIRDNLNKISKLIGLTAWCAAGASGALDAANLTEPLSDRALLFLLFGGTALITYGLHAEILWPYRELLSRGLVLHGYDLRAEHCRTFCVPRSPGLRVVGSNDDTVVLPAISETSLVPPTPLPRRGGRHHRRKG